MTTKNGDMPAMPMAVGADGRQFTAKDLPMFINNPAANGLTKREMMAMHMLAGLLASEGKPDLQYESSLAVKAADALLAELERTK